MESARGKIEENIVGNYEQYYHRRRQLRKFLQNQIFLAILIFIFAFGIRLYYVFQKETLMHDEVGSIVIVTLNDYFWNVNFDENKIYTGKEIKEITFFTSSSIKEALTDVKNLRLYDRDGPHTNLYYSCLRLWFAGTQTSNVQRIIIQGCLLNLLFFSLSFLFLYKLAKLLFTNKWIILLALVVAFLNTGAISTTMYIRMYQLQETLLIMFAWLFVYLWQKIDLKQQIDLWQNLLLIAIITGLTLLVGYTSIFFVIPFSAFFLYKLYKEKQIKNIYFIICSFIAALVFVFAVYPIYQKGFTSFQATDAISNITNTTNFIHNIIVSCINYVKILHKYLFYTFIILFICISLLYILWDKRKNLRFLFLQPLPIILFISFLCTIVIIILAPMKWCYYYIYPVIPLLALVIPYIVAKFNQSKIVLVALFLCLIVYSYYALLPNRIEFLRKGEAQNIIFCQKQNMFLCQRPEIPVIIRTNNVWKFFSIIPLLQDAQFYEFSYSDEMLMKKINNYREVFVIIEKNENNDFVFPENYSIVETNSSYIWFFYCISFT